MSLNPDSPFTPLAWFLDLTYEEIHAAAYGLGLGFGIGASAYFNAPELTRSLTLLALSLVYYGMTGEERFLKRFGLRAVEDWVLVQIRHETHYFIGGLLGGAILAYHVGLYTPEMMPTLVRILESIVPFSVGFGATRRMLDMASGERQTPA